MSQKLAIFFDLLVFALACIVFYEREFGVAYLLLVGVLLLALHYGLVKKGRKEYEQQHLDKHSLEITDKHLLFHWPEGKYEVALNQVERAIVKKTKNRVSKIRLKTKPGRSIDLDGYESMQELLDTLVNMIGKDNVTYVKWYWPNDL